MGVIVVIVVLSLSVLGYGYIAYRLTSRFVQTVQKHLAELDALEEERLHDES